MRLFNLLIIFGLLCLFISNEEEEKNIDIIEGVTYYEDIINETFKFTAIDDGHYLITFNYTACIFEVQGDIPQDFFLEKNDEKGWITSAYAQKFKKGDYFKIFFPYNINNTGIYSIKIEKINSDINLRFFHNKENFIENLYINDCLNSTYIFIKNPFYENFNQKENDNLIYLKSIIHSGEFSSSYKISDYFYNENEKLIDSYKEFNINNLSFLPNNYFFNIIELKCKTPGLLTLIYSASNSFESPTEFTTHSLENEGIVQNRFNFSHKIVLNIKNNGTYFFELFNIHGCANFDMTSINGKKYECSDFYLNQNFENKNYYKIPMTVVKEPFWFISVLHQPYQNDNIILEKEKEIYNITIPGSKYIIPIDNNSKKKFIKVNCSIPNYYWTLEFSNQKNESYLPYPHGTKPKLVNDNVIYIRNPNSFDKNNNMYIWYIILYLFDKDDLPNIYYRYVDKETDYSDDFPNEDEDENEDKKTFFKSTLFWILLISIIIIIGIILGILIYYKCCRKPRKEELLIKGTDERESEFRIARESTQNKVDNWL